jgi:hypothetical protein
MKFDHKKISNNWESEAYPSVFNILLNLEEAIYNVQEGSRFMAIDNIKVALAKLQKITPKK